MKALLQKKLFSRFGAALFDQMILAAANFAVAILLIKTVTKEAFGLYAVIFPISLFLISLQNALINSPMTVLLTEKNDADREKYLAGLFWGQVRSITPIMGVAALILALLMILGAPQDIVYAGLSVCAAAIGLLLREFLRALYFAEEKPGKVLRMDVIYLTLFFGLLFGLHQTLGVSVPGVFGAMGLSALLVTVFEAGRLSWLRQKGDFRRGFLENWGHGRWALLGVCVTHVQSYSFLYLIGAMLGSVIVADIAAARVLMRPVALINAGWGKVATPRGARLRQEGKIRKLFREQIGVTAMIVAGIVVYTLLVLAAESVLLTNVLSDKYAEAFQYIPLLGLIAMFSFVSLNASYALRACKRFDVVSKAGVVTMTLTIVLSLILIPILGAKGALVALLAGELALSAGLWRALARETQTVQKQDSSQMLYQVG